MLVRAAQDMSALTDDEREALAALRTDHPELARANDEMRIRFLRARDLNIGKAAKLLAGHLEFLERNRPDQVGRQRQRRRRRKKERKKEEEDGDDGDKEDDDEEEERKNE